jgi:ribonuclease HI
MISVTTDGGARPNPGKAGWGIVLRQNQKFACMWKHHPNASNNLMELSAVIVALAFLRPNMAVWVSTDSQYVQKGVNEWMPTCKQNGWRNSKKGSVGNKSLWRELDAQIARHKLGQFSWVNAHSGIVHNEIADTLATRGAGESSYCPTNRYDELPGDTETEDRLEMRDVDQLITQDDELDEDLHLPTFSTEVCSLALEATDCDREFRHFSHDILGNSTAEVSPEDSDSDMRTQGDHTLVMNGGMRVEDGGIVDLPGVPFKTWDSHYSWAQAKADAARGRAEEQAFIAEFGWMTEAITCERFAEESEQRGVSIFKAIETRKLPEDQAHR